MLKNRKYSIENQLISSSEDKDKTDKNTLKLAYRSYAENLSEFIEAIGKDNLGYKYDDFIKESKHFEILENLNNFLINAGRIAFFRDEPVNLSLIHISEPTRPY